MRKTTRALLLAGTVAATWPAIALADDAKPAEPAKPAIPTLGDVLGASGITATGYLDIAYEWMTTSGTFQSTSFDSHGNSILVPGGANSRVFDYEHNSFNVQQAAITVAKQPTEGFGALVNLTAGKDASTIRSYDENMNDFDVTQAFLQYAHGPLTIIGGKFVTLAGAETINPTTDTNYSRSILFGYAIPFTHTGVRATYAVNDQLSLILGVNNGWDQLKDENTQKTAEAGVSFTPNKMLSFSAQGYSGTEQVAGAGDTHQGTRNLVDLVATVNVSDQLTIIINPDWGTQDDAVDLTTAPSAANMDPRKKATWWGVAGYVNYQLSDQWRVSFRAEYFDDKDGYRTGVIQKWKEGTLTLAYMPTKSVELRAEVRGDKSDQNSFLDTDHVSGKSTNTSIGFEGIYKF